MEEQDKTMQRSSNIQGGPLENPNKLVRDEMTESKEPPKEDKQSQKGEKQ